MIAKTAHEHDLRTIGLIRIMEVHKDYNGTAGDKALLVRKCSCGYSKAVEMGSYSAMQKQLKLLGGEEKLSSVENGVDDGGKGAEQGSIASHPRDEGGDSSTSGGPQDDMPEFNQLGLGQ